MPATWDWSAYLTFAASLAPFSEATVDDKARARAAISRAYYSAYHHARGYVLRNGIKTEDELGKKHGNVWQGLMEGTRSEDERQAGAFGDGLMDDRHLADYNERVRKAKKPAKPFKPSEAAKSAISRSRQIRDWLTPTGKI